MGQIPSDVNSLKLLKHIFLLGLLFIFSGQVLQAQVTVTKSWDKRFGGSSEDELYSMITTADGGYLLGGLSHSDAGGDKTTVNRGNSDYWVVKLNADGSKAWDKSFGGRGDDFFASVINTADGGFLLGGHSNSYISEDKTEDPKGNEDYWVVKLNADGSKAWDKTIGGSGTDILTSQIATADGGFLLGGYSRSGAGGDKTEDSRGIVDYWVVKLNADGSKAWDKTYGGSDMDNLKDLLLTSDGGFLLGGESYSSAGGDKSDDFRGANGASDYWVVKLNADGSKAWDRTYGGNGYDELTTLIRSTDGGYLLGGQSDSEASGDKTEETAWHLDYWVIKINADGSKVWDQTIGGDSEEYLTSLIATADGGYLLGGVSSSDISGDRTDLDKGAPDYWLVKLDASGRKSWDKSFGGESEDALTAMVITSDGGYLLGGHSRSGAGGDKTEDSRENSLDYWVIKLSNSALSTELSEADNQNLLVYPNPGKGEFYIVHSAIKPGPEPVELVLYNTLGQQVLHQSVKGSELQNGILLKTTSVSSGTYFLNLQIQDKVLTKKVIFY